MCERNGFVDMAWRCGCDKDRNDTEPCIIYKCCIEPWIAHSKPKNSRLYASLMCVCARSLNTLRYVCMSTARKNIFLRLFLLSLSVVNLFLRKSIKISNSAPRTQTHTIECSRVWAFVRALYFMYKTQQPQRV